MYKLAIVLALLASGTAGAQDASAAPHMNARDVFWSAKDLVSVSPNPGSTGARAARPPVKRVAAKPHTRPAAKHPADTEVAESRHQLNPQVVAANGYGAQPHLVSLTTEHIGLRYTLLQESAGGRYQEVLPSTVFHSGDRVKLSVMANHPGYLYIIQKGSSGAWSPIYPSSDAAPDSNYVEAGRVYEVPGDGAFEFNQQPGNEHVFIVLSAAPITDLDGAIFGLKAPQAAPAAPAEPASAPPNPSAGGEVLMASNHVPDELIQKLASRDLIPVQEQVNTPPQESGSGATQAGEKAVYVVNSLPAQGSSSRVVATLVLDHE